MNLSNFVQITGHEPILFNNKLGFPEEAIHRFLGRVSPQPDGCWIWIGAQNQGYGLFECRASESSKRSWRAHRLAYGWAYGLPSHEYHLHHKCRNKICVNPDHLEPLTFEEHGREEKRLKGFESHCARGHLYTPETTINNGNGRRQCRTCVNARNKEKYAAAFAKGKPAPVQFCKYGHPFDEENTYHYTTPAGGPGRGCRICRNNQRRIQTERARQKFAETLHLIKPKTTHCFNGHSYEEVGWGVEHTGVIKCKQCKRDEVNRRNAIKRAATPPKTHCVKGHDLSIYGYKSPRGDFRIICRECFGHKKKNLLPDGTLNFGGTIAQNA